MSYCLKLKESLIFGYRLFFLLLFYLLGILGAFLFESAFSSITGILYLVCLASILFFIRLPKRYSFILLSVSLFLCSFLYYLTIFSYQKKTPLIQTQGAIGGVVWDASKDVLKVKLLSQNRRYLGYFLKLKSSKHLFPIGTLVSLDPKGIKEHYYRPRRFLSSSQIPLPWLNDIDILSKIIARSAQARYFLKTKLSNSFKNYPNLRAFCLSALIQIKSDKSQVIQDAMKNLGLTHIFAVSGFHVSVLSLFVLFFCRLLRFNFSYSFVALSLFLISYAALTGFTASIFRAFVFSLILFPKKVLNQDVDRVHVLSIICFCHLLWSPLEVFNIGFQLSYGITFLLLFFSRGYNSSIKLWLVQAFTMQLCIYIYFLFYFQEFPLFSFVGVFLTPLFSIVLMVGFIFLFTPTFLFDVFLVKWILQFFEVLLSKVFTFGENLNYILKSELVLKLYFVLPSFLVIIAVYLCFEKAILRIKKVLRLQSFLKHLVSISGQDFEGFGEVSEIQKWELEYLLYKNIDQARRTRLRWSFELCKEWLALMKFSKIEVFIELILNSFYKDLYLKCCEETLSREHYNDLTLDLDRLKELEQGRRLVSSDHLHSIFLGFCKRYKISLEGDQMRAHLKVALSYQRFQNLKNYGHSSLVSSCLFIKYLVSSYFLFKQYSK